MKINSEENKKMVDWVKILEEESPEFRQMTQKQKNILISAAELFGEKGYDATSTKEIAVRAGVAEATIFKHYKTKKDLILTLYSKVISKIAFPLINTGLDDIFDREYHSAEAFFRDLLENRIDIIAGCMPLLRIVLQEIPFQPEIRGLFSRTVQRIRIKEAFSKLSRKGLIINLPEDELMKLFVSTLMGYLFTHYVLIPEFFNADPEKELDNFIGFVVRGMTPAES